MAIVLLTTTSASPQTWMPAVPAGTLITVETWGAGSGASGGSTSFRAGGAGAAWATDSYYLSPDNVANGVSYVLQAGSAGTAAANPSAGPDTTWASGNSVNLTSNSQMRGRWSNTLPTNWSTVPAAGITATVVGSGIDDQGYPYVDVNFAGTGTGGGTLSSALFVDTTFTIAVSTAYTYTLYAAVLSTGGSSLTNVNSTQLQTTELLSGSFVTAPAGSALSLTETMVRQTLSFTSTTGINQAQPYISLFHTSGLAINVTYRVGAPQFEQAASATVWKPTPGRVTAKGGSASSGTTGGAGGLASACVPTAGAFNGGSGATRTQGGGGGASAGKNGAGGSSTTGTGATGDNALGGAASVSNVEGGGGATAATSPVAAGDPGGGGGASTSTNAGSAGGRGQIRLSWVDSSAPAVIHPPTLAPFCMGPGRGPRPLVPQPWRYYVPLANAAITTTQDDQTVVATATMLANATIAQTQDDQTVTASATVGAEPIAARSPFRLLPGKGPRPLVPQPWRFNFPADARAVIAATQDDQTSSITATVGAEPIARRSPFRLLPGKGPRPLVPNPWRGDFSAPTGGAVIAQTQDDQTAAIAATNLDHAIVVQTQDDQTASITGTVLDTAVIVQTQADQTIAATATNASHAALAQTQDDQTASITASVGAVSVAVRSPFRLLPGRGPRPLVPNPWRYVVPSDVHASIIQTQDDQTISATGTQANDADIDQNQDDHTISSTAALLAAATIAQTQSNQTIVSAATNRDHAAIVQTQDDQTIVATALRLLPLTAAIVQTQQDQTIHMAAGLPRVTVAQPQFLW